jgi:Icc-related predicted phosphoesterase
VRFVALSDTHGLHASLQVPLGEILLFAGDMCGRGRLEEVREFGSWLAALPHKHKIVIAGNHDWPFEREPEEARKALGDVIYLQDQQVTIEGFKIYGSPWQPEFGRWAFNLKRGEELREVWSKIPTDTDILLTHGPPYGTLDRTYDRRLVGCDDLRARLADLTELKAHIFGHIHESYGRGEKDDCLFYNASVCDLAQRGVRNRPWAFDLSS